MRKYYNYYYYCLGCQKKVKIEWWHVKIMWYPDIKGFKRVYGITCPYCNKKHEVSFAKIPLISKMRFIKEELSFQWLIFVVRIYP